MNIAFLTILNILVITIQIIPFFIYEFQGGEHYIHAANIAAILIALNAFLIDRLPFTKMPSLSFVSYTSGNLIQLKTTIYNPNNYDINIIGFKNSYFD